MGQVAGWSLPLQRGKQRFPTAAVALKDLRSELFVPVAWSAEWGRVVEMQDEEGSARRSLPPLAPAAAFGAAFVGLRVEMLGQFFFHDSLQQCLKESPHGYWLGF